MDDVCIDRIDISDDEVFSVFEVAGMIGQIRYVRGHHETTCTVLVDDGQVCRTLEIVAPPAEKVYPYGVRWLEWEYKNELLVDFKNFCLSEQPFKQFKEHMAMANS